jgi:dihydroorotate dehydrogenase electron transfer subunit
VERKAGGENSARLKRPFEADHHTNDAAKVSTPWNSFANMAVMFDETVAVVGNRPLTGGHFLLSLHSPRQAQAARPGQFAMVRLLGRSDVLLRRPMSIYEVKAAARNGKRGARKPAEIIQFLYKVVGRGTRLMSELKAGDPVGLLGPLGHGFFEEEYSERTQRADETLLVAGGIGIAALLLPARQLATSGHHTRLFFGARTGAEIVGVQDFAPWVEETVLATEDGSLGHRGFVTQPLKTFLDRRAKKKFVVMTCGPMPMLQAVVKLTTQYGHPCLVSMENRMGCGLGVCLGCSIRVHGQGHEAYQRVCTEGPVFWADKVIWEDTRVTKT